MTLSSQLPTLAQVRTELARRHLADYVEYTTNLKLHTWQRDHLCPRLERLKDEKGARILIHGPPQFGKSVILTKRFPAWYVGHNIDNRVVVAAYNVTHATGLTGVVRDTMQGERHSAVFPNPNGLLLNPSAEGEFFTVARDSQNDAQPTVRAVGLLSGFTGTGADLLLVDDPYASPDDARSEAINERVWRWWTELAGVRINDDTNVVVMFHRYHEDDLAGRLMAEGGWEYIRFPAIADANEDGSDPTGRQPGEVLSPIRSLGFLQAQEARDEQTFLGQFQGVPRRPDGALIKREWLKQSSTVPNIEIWVRYWDLATSIKEAADYHAGALVGMDTDGTLYLKDIVWGKAEWPDLAEIIVATASKDMIECQKAGHQYHIGADARMTQQGFFQDLIRKAALGRIPLWPDDSRGNKRERAYGWITRAKFDKFRMVPGVWDMQSFIKECLAFRGDDTTHDDQVDAISGAYQLLWSLRGGGTEEEKFPEVGTPEFYDKILENYRVVERDDDED